jgi:hypothetical protein
VLQIWLETGSVHLQEGRRVEAVEVLGQAVGALMMEADAAPELAEHVVLPAGELLGDIVIIALVSVVLSKVQ